MEIRQFKGNCAVRVSLSGRESFCLNRVEKTLQQ